MELEALIGAEVELSTPDGRVFHFRVASLVPYAGEAYAVLEHMAEDGQLLVTHVETGADQAPVFVVVGEEDIISGVLEKQVAQTIARAMQKAEEEDQEDEEDQCDCGCHHEGHDCHCGHDHQHQDHCHCGHDHAHDHSCSCGHHHRPMPSYIKKQS